MATSETTGDDATQNLEHPQEYMEHRDTLQDHTLNVSYDSDTPVQSYNRDVENSAGKNADAADPNIITWGPDDPDHPYNWPRWKMLLNFFWVAFLTFVSPLASSIFAPAVPQIMVEFGSDSTVLESFVLSIYLLGFAAGPLITAPLSELYGRLPVYHVSNIGFIAFSVACALSTSLGSLIVFRFFAGVFGATPISNGGGSVGDVIRPEKRAVAMSAYLLGPLFGPVVGPIAGGFLTEARGWPWCFWLIAIISGFIEIGMIFTMNETYPPILLKRKVQRMRKETGNKQLRSTLDSHTKSASKVFKLAIIRPLKLLFLSPILNLTSFYAALAYGYIYIIFTSQAIVFQGTYGFSTNLLGLTYLGIGIGTLLGTVLYSSTSDKYLKRKSAEADKISEAEGHEKEGLRAEYRLFLFPVGAILLPIGMFLYGWSAQEHVHWMVPIIGTGFVGCSSIIFMMSVMTYLIDAFEVYAASALAASTVLRSLFGAFLPLAGLPLYENLGVGWGNSLLGFLALLLVPTSFLIIKYGEPIRKKYAVKNL